MKPFNSTLGEDSILCPNAINRRRIKSLEPQPRPIPSILEKECPRVYFPPIMCFFLQVIAWSAAHVPAVWQTEVPLQ